VTLRPGRPPAAARWPVEREVHGERLVDDYAWLRDKAHAEVAAYLGAENAWTDAVLAPLATFRGQLYDEMFARIKHEDSSVPYPEQGYWYYQRTAAGQQYPMHCRRIGSPDGPEEVLLDLNVMAEGRSYLALGVFAPSDDGRYLAFSTDATGFREYTLQVKDLATGALLAETIPHTGSVAWAADNRTLFYTIEDTAKRKYRLYRHVLGQDSADDVLVFEETDERFGIGVARGQSGRFVMLYSGSHTTSEIQVLEARVPEGAWRVLAPRVDDQEYDAAHRGDQFFVRVNDTGRNFRMVTAPVDTPGREHWLEWLPHRDEVMLEDFDLFAGHLVLWEREDGVPHAHIINLDTSEAHRLSFDEEVYEAYPGMNHVWETTTLRLEYQSLVTPPSVFDYDMVTRERVLRKQKEVVGGYDPSAYATHRLHALAADGTRIPISLVYRKDRRREGGSPLLLKGYGAYAYPYPIAFSSERLSLLDRGVVVAIAHVRGGGELGRPWHDGGRMQHKMNTFTDFLACADALAEEGWADPGLLAAEGGSAGGLLMGVVVNLRPERWRAVVSHVPFVDVINTMLDPTLPLTVGEYEEWGNPALEPEYRWIRAYCPYTNLRPGPFPAMLIRTALNDSQVMYWEPAKYVAKVRTLQTNDAPVLLETNMGAGHGGASGRYDRLHEQALDHAFLLWQLGLAETA
jgi:oligopeptidase B